MARVHIDLNTQINSAANIKGAAKAGGLVGQSITEKLFGVNFLSSFERGDLFGGRENYDDIVRALGNISGDNTNGSFNGITAPITTMRFPGGTLTEQFYARNENVLHIDTKVNFGSRTGISVKEFIALCEDLGSDMTHVMPTWRYLDTRGLTETDRIELYAYVKALLSEALQKGVSVNAFEIGNEYWDAISAHGIKESRMTAAEYGKIAAEQAAVLQKAIADFQNENSAQIARTEGWVTSKILVQLGAPSGDVANIGYFKAQNDTRDIIKAFDTPDLRAAVDGFVAHRYEMTIDNVGDPWVQAKPLHFQALPAMLTAPGWKTLDQMTLSVSDWNLDQKSLETGLQSFSTVVAMMGELVSLGVDAADFWSVAARSRFPMAQFEGGAYSTTANFSGLTFTGEAFRMMNESLRGKKSLMLYEKSAGKLIGLDGNKFDMAKGDNMRTYVEAFSDGQEVVIFISNLSGVNDVLNLVQAGMIGRNKFHAWGTLIESSSSNLLDSTAAPIVTNMNLTLNKGVLKDFQLGAYETLRVTLTVGKFGADVMGYHKNDNLSGSAFSDVMDGRNGNDTLLGLAGNDTIFGGDGFDFLYGGAGHDHIFGGAGNDFLDGGLGNDYIYGGDGIDTATFFGKGRIVVDLSNHGPQNTGQGIDVLSSIENLWSGSGHDRLFGSVGANTIKGGAGNDYIDGRAGADYLEGNMGNDTIFGGIGNDVINGGPGADVLYGGVGADVFVFGRDSGRDRIMDFQDTVDRIQLTNSAQNFADLTIFAVKGGVAVSHAPGAVITVLGVQMWQITEADFLFA